MFGENRFMEDEFFKRIAELRHKKGVSAREMSLAVGQSKGYINNIENGHNFPKMAIFFYICDYLGVTPKEFFDVDNRDPSRISELAEKMKGLNDEQLSLLESMIDNLK